MALSCLLTFLPMTSAQAQEISGFATANFFLSSSESGGTTTDLNSFNSTLELTWNRRVSSLFQYRLNVRGRYNDSRTETDSEVTTNSRFAVEPIFDLTLSGPTYSLNTGIRFLEGANDGNQVERLRLSDRRVFARFSLTPEKWPSLSVLFDTFTFDATEDPGISIRDRTENRFNVSTEYGFETVNLFYSFIGRFDDDALAGVTRDQMNHVGTVAYSDSFFQDRLDVDANFTLDYTSINETFSIPSDVDVPRELSRGLQAGPDPTPTDNSDVPVTDAPGLITGAANIPLELLSSVGFQIVASESVTQIQISLAPEPPFTLPDNLTAFLNFRVFFTDDPTLVTWTAARSFKAYVNQNDFGTLVLATRIQAQDVEQVGAGQERDRSTFIQRFGTDLTYRPVGWITGTLDFLLTNTVNDPGSNRTTIGNLSARLTAELHRLLTGAFTWQHNFSDSNQPGSEDRTDDTFTLIFTSTPLPTLTSSLSLNHIENRTEGELQTRSSTASLNASAQLYRNLNFDSTFSFSRSEDLMLDQTSLGQAVALNTSAILTDKLSATLGYTFQRTDTEGQLLDRITITQAATGTFTYTLSRLLNFNASLNFTDTENATILGQNYKLDWIPTSRVSSFIEYTRTDATGDAIGSDAVNITGTWNISRYFNARARFLFFRSRAGDMSQSFNGSVQFRF
jgi:hypothetical protein